MSTLICSTENGKQFCGRPLKIRGCSCTHCHSHCNCVECMKADLEGANLSRGWLVNASGKAAKLVNGKFHCTKTLMFNGGVTLGQEDWCCGECNDLTINLNRYRELL